jgi:hypothetical protein
MATVEAGFRLVFEALRFAVDTVEDYR